VGQDNLSDAHLAPEVKLTHSVLSMDHKDALLVLGHMFFQHRQSDKALILFEALQVLFPEDFHVRLSLAYAYLINGRYADALELAARCERDTGTMFKGKASPKALIEICALWALHRKDEARQQFQTLTNGLTRL
jgi:tetratricopeptide (TPR) repeat protein